MARGKLNLINKVLGSRQNSPTFMHSTFCHGRIERPFRKSTACVLYLKNSGFHSPESIQDLQFRSYHSVSCSGGPGVSSGRRETLHNHSRKPLCAFRKLATGSIGGFWACSTRRCCSHGKGCAGAGMLYRFRNSYHKER